MPVNDDLKSRFEDALEVNSIENVTYKQWMQVDKSVLETITNTTQEFVDDFFESLPKQLRHSFIVTQQSSYFRHLKKKIYLKMDVGIVHCDFAENYAFILQDAMQGFHWNNSQAKIHPFVTYNLDEESKKLVH